MSDLPADAAAQPPADRWNNRWFVLLLLAALAVHLALLFLFGARKQIVPMLAGPVPHLQLADRANELVALTDPTLFARPNAHDLVTAYWREIPRLPPHDFNWHEDPHYLAPAIADFGSLFHEFVKNDRPARFQPDFKPAPEVVVPAMPLDNPVPPATTLVISPELAHRPLRDTVALPSWPRNDVLGPSTVQVLVDRDGNVASAVVLHTSGDNDADQKAMQLAGSLRFAPAAQTAIGSLTFYWHTVPANAPAANVP